MTRMLLALIFLIMGCGRSVPPSEYVQQPVRVTSLPVPDSHLEVRETELGVLLQIMPDGTVNNAVIFKGALNKEWNEAVVDSLLKWRFSSLEGGDVDGRWHRRQIKVQFEEPLYLNIAEFISTSREVADSLFRVLNRIEDLEAHLREDNDRTGYTVSVHKNHDIAHYPYHIRRQLRILRENRAIRPVLLDGNFVMIYRLPQEDLVN
ncbi:MAG: hypothetical protein LAT57_10940 [Balneolales bacterium]|nr:hypothetical protein [Balneolales bacterium]